MTSTAPTPEATLVALRRCLDKQGERITTLELQVETLREELNRRVGSVNGLGIRAIREAKGLKLSQLATRCAVSTGYLSNIEAGRKQPAPDVVRRIADELGVSPLAFSVAAA